MLAILLTLPIWVDTRPPQAPPIRPPQAPAVRVDLDDKPHVVVPEVWVPTTRQPVGHTHTCPRCNVTWDHQANPGHNCANCGTAQYVQDPFPRPVTVWNRVQRPVGPAAPSVQYTLPPSGVYSGCGPAGCPTVPVQTRRGLFR